MNVGALYVGTDANGVNVNVVGNASVGGNITTNTLNSTGNFEVGVANARKFTVAASSGKGVGHAGCGYHDVGHAHGD